MIGGIRRAVVSVGYEIMFSLNILLFILYSKRGTLERISNVGLLMLFFSFFISLLVELGRTPFDYRESERELVSGFNTEYRRARFVLLFLKEYGTLLFFRYVVSTVFFYSNFLMFTVVFVSFIFIRSSFPRLRFDKIIKLI